MNMTWLNRGVYTLLERIGNFSVFFTSVSRWLAVICFVIALGMVCIEIFLQACDARKELIRLSVTVVSYFIMIVLFPVCMKGLLKLGMDLGYGAVFSGGLYEADVSGTSGALHASEADFYKWLDEESGGIFSTTENDDGSRVALQFNIVDAKTGYIDLNKTFTYILAFIKIGWKCFPHLTLFKASFTAIGVCFLFFFALIVVIVCYFVVLINYIMCLIDYFALTGYGILMIPLSLWKGTKGYTQAVMGGIGHILIKLIVISSLMFLSIMSIVDLFTQVYIHSVIVEGVSLAVEIDDLLNMSVTLLFQAPLLAVITMQTEKIANFLCSGNPQLSFGDFALGAAQTAAMGGGASYATKAASNAASTASSAVSSGITGGMAAKAMGGGARSMAKSAMSSFGNTIGGEMKASGQNLKGQMADGLNDFSRMTGMYRANGCRNFVKSSSTLNNPHTSTVPDLSTIGKTPLNSEKPSERSEGMENSDAMASFKNGSEGVYGNVTSDSVTDKAIGLSNKLSQGGMASRILGGHIGEAASIAKTIKNVHAEHKSGNRVGNGYGKNVGKTILDSRIASSSNIHGGSKVSFSKKDMRAPENFRGEKANVISRGAGAKSVMMSNGEMGRDKYIVQSPKDLFNGVSDKDAIDNIKEINKEKEKENEE